jgi:hypothetical protein
LLLRSGELDSGEALPERRHEKSAQPRDLREGYSNRRHALVFMPDADDQRGELWVEGQLQGTAALVEEQLTPGRELPYLAHGYLDALERRSGRA